MTTSKHDIVIERLNALSEHITTHTDHTRREINNLEKNLDKINASIVLLDGKVHIQNGRVNKLESAQANCPGNELKKVFTQYQDDLKPIYILATNYKMVAFFVVGIALAMKFVNLSVEYVVTLLTL